MDVRLLGSGSSKRAIVMDAMFSAESSSDWVGKPFGKQIEVHQRGWKFGTAKHTNQTRHMIGK